MTAPLAQLTEAERKGLALFYLDECRAHIVAGRLSEASAAIAEAILHVAAIEREAARC